MSSEVAISPPTVAVIGGGWYGCHIAYTLRQRGFVVTLFESAPEIFTGASGKNQFRLHAGFHYPRSQNTRKQITRGLMEFNKRMPQFVKKLDSCIYAISNQSSLLDFGTFTSVFEAEQVPFEHVHPQVYGLSNVEGAVHTPTEEYFLVDTPRSFYKVYSNFFVDIILQSNTSLACAGNCHQNRCYCEGNEYRYRARWFDIRTSCIQ